MKIPRTIYHYCNTRTFLSIISSGQLWLTDVAQSNDYMEMKTLYERVLEKMLSIYEKEPFDLIYYDKVGSDALIELILECKSYIENRFLDGELNCYVICFSEKGDLLSQWRGYADDSRGFSIGISTKAIISYIENNKDFLGLEKVSYKSDRELETISTETAQDLLMELSTLRKFIEEEMTTEVKEVNSLMGFNFTSAIISVIYDSVLIKNDSFREEKEWRLYTKKINTKVFIESYNEEEFYGPLNTNVIKEVKDRISFYAIDNQIKSYIGFKFAEMKLGSEEQCINEVIIGSKNNTCYKDLDLLLKKYGSHKVKIKSSNLSYR